VRPLETVSSPGLRRGGCWHACLTRPWFATDREGIAGASRRPAEQAGTMRRHGFARPFVLARVAWLDASPPQSASLIACTAADQR
jgi:hypothetical protein